MKLVYIVNVERNHKTNTLLRYFLDACHMNKLTTTSIKLSKVLV